METLLKLSGLLNEEDGDRTDLGTLEKRLADKTLNQSNGGTPTKSPRRSDSVLQPSASSESHHGIPQQQQQQERTSSLQTSAASPENGKRSEEEVEALSDLMCSLVTNNQGESRYIGMSVSSFQFVLLAYDPRLFIWIFYLFAKGHSVGQ